jgi:hypothetical protein
LLKLNLKIAKEVGFVEKYDVIVAGGGFAGFAAAVAAAREGASVLLFDKSNCLGGAASNCLVNPFMDTHTVIDGERVALCRGIYLEVCAELEKMNKEMQDEKNFGGCLVFHEEYLKIIMNRMALNAGVELLFHAYLSDVKKSDGKINAVTVSTKSGMLDLEADYFIDATGDGDLAVLADCPYVLGRPKDNLCQPMTLCFRVAGVDLEAYHANRPEIDKLYKEFQSQGKIKNPREDVLIFHNMVDGVLHFNSTRIVKLNPTDVFDVTKAEIEAREQVVELFKFMRENIKGFEHSTLLMTAAEIGVRESRMIEGEYVLTGDDLVALKDFDDSIACGNYDIDIHNPEGTGTSHRYFKKGEYYKIPYRSLIPKNCDNLLVAGRCISVDHEAQASIRIMPIVCAIGEAAGTAVSVSVKDKTTPKNTDVKKVQQILVKNGAKYE